MKRASILLASVFLLAGAPYENETRDGEALSRPITGLDETLARSFRAGGGLFRRAWVIGPSRDQEEVAGLGPLYNRLSCIACHVKNGRGAAPDPENGVARAMVVRLGVPGKDAHGGPLPHPVYGAQLNPDGVPDVPGEGRAIVSYEEFETTLADGATVSMRRPHLSFSHLGYGPLDATVKTSARNAPPAFGLGLLEAIPEKEILEYARTHPGKANYVFDVESGETRLGRFGLKANQPSLKQQIANAFVEDLGISNELYPTANCTTAQPDCKAAAEAETRVELKPSQLADTTDFIRLLAVPARRDADNPLVAEGEALFQAIGCAACHRETLHVGVFPAQPALSGVAIHPYTDLLLHDMGDGLADGREDFDAGPRDWRTPPLWGLGLVGQFGDGANYLHDGRARSVTEAILWHSGEARDAADVFRGFSKKQRDALLAFLNSL